MIDNYLKKRDLIENLQNIELEISKKFRQNPYISPNFNQNQDNEEDKDNEDEIIFKNRKKKTFKQNLKDSLKIGQLIKNYEFQRLELEKLETTKIEFSFEQFNTLYNEILSKPNIPQLQDQNSKISLSKIFKSTESYGQYLDLTSIHQLYLNLSNSNKLNYIQWLKNLIDLKFYNENLFKTNQYWDYLIQLKNYLIEFISKINPLINIAKFLNQLKIVDNDDNSLYCKYCQKTFSKDTVFNSHLLGKKHLKNYQNFKDFNKIIYQIHQLLINYLLNIHKNTILNLERKLLLTDRERQLELNQIINDSDSDETEESEESDDSDKIDETPDFSNEGLQLDSSGNPIPNWLYKLQGLTLTFTCEICGNETFKGRKSFDLHFQSSRHLHGLKCLGINNPSVLFNDINTIKDAIQLWSHMEKKQLKEKLIKEDGIEVEDEEGNVMSEKVYKELEKQGLV
ncbi:hypothetical protein WICMUC_005568 [Wickerhamomyces mucosus]|uniref:C2H2-type domain-containing protein n=1 Tax=Wickerhamomyces mucosus TaxID=1378264 RepID=A0A9P8P7R4_9ASCO|nr:hypothetical protein WICMUC_005568 [Wickerhamomyces mucosus]